MRMKRMTGSNFLSGTNGNELDALSPRTFTPFFTRIFYVLPPQFDPMKNWLSNRKHWGEKQEWACELTREENVALTKKVGYRKKKLYMTNERIVMRIQKTGRRCGVLDCQLPNLKALKRRAMVWLFMTRSDSLLGLMASINQRIHLKSDVSLREGVKGSGEKRG
jgi:hypothetical protein